MNLTLPVPTAGWYELALVPDRRPGLLAEQVAGLTSAELRDWFAAALTTLAEHYAAVGCQLAAVAWDPASAGQPHAVLQVSVTPWRPAGADPIGQLTTELAADRPGDIGPRTVEAVPLPAGTAVRVRMLADGGADPAGRQVVSDVVQYWLPLPDRGVAVVAATSTAILTDGDQLAALLDTLMPLLAVTD